MTGEERHFLTVLENPHDQERAIAAFWRSRGEAARLRWSRNAVGAEQLRPRSLDARHAALMFGKPAEINQYPSCGGIRSLEVWRWEPWHLQRQGGEADSDVYLVFAQASRLDSRSFRGWDPAVPAELGYAVSPDVDLDGFLGSSAVQGCLSSDLEYALRRAGSFSELRRRMPWPDPASGWSESLGQESERPGVYPARLRLSYPGSYGRHTLVRGLLSFPREELARLSSGQFLDRISVVGDIHQRDWLVDSFEIVHHVAGTPPGPVVELEVYRRLRAGSYRLNLRATDQSGRTLVRVDREIEVPARTEPAPDPPGRARGFERLTSSEVTVLDTFPSIELLPVGGKGSARVTAQAITTGGPISAVEFRLNGELLATDPVPPYQVEVAFGEDQPLLEALALDGAGRELTRDSRRLEQEGLPLTIRLSRPVANQSSVAVRVSLPEGELVDRLECYHGRRLVSTQTAGPYSCSLPEPPYFGIEYVRALVTLAGGDSAEHLIFLGPDAPEEIEVRLVELYTSVADASGRPVTDLSAADFQVRDGGAVRELVRAESLANLPISVAVLTDLSSSMGRLTGLAAASAQDFFETILVDDDVASLLAFNHDLHRLVPFTGDALELRHGAFGLHSLGSTRLHDGVVWALSQFSGQENRRALVVLSDGNDVDSDFALEQVIQAAIQAGVAVYPISLVRPREKAPAGLEALADRAGGRHFVVNSISQLDSAYQRIEEELRSQYLLVYRMPEDAEGFQFRPVEVEVLRPGLATRNVRGYYQ